MPEVAGPVRREDAVGGALPLGSANGRGEPPADRTAELEEQVAILEATLDATADGVLVVDASGRATRFNRRFLDLWQLPLPLSDEHPGDLLPFVVDRLVDPESFARRVGELYASSEQSGSGTVRLLDDRAVEWVSRPLRRGKVTVGRVWSFCDVTECRRASTRLEHVALHDPLTGMPNRDLFLDRATVALERGRRHGRQVAVLFLDLDGFKVVNESLGHAAGDALLVAVASRLAAVVRPGDTVARFGGDEFGVLCEDLTTEKQAQLLAERLAAAAGEPLRLAGHEVVLTTSVGIALGRGGEDEAGMLVRDAEAAMYVAKGRRRGGVEMFDPDVRARVVRRMRTESALRGAIERNELELAYQPVVRLGEPDMVTGVEALIRWNHPELGQVAPADFIPLAEETDLIVPIGDWVLRTSCRQAVALRRAGHPLQVSVNLSARQLADPALLGWVRSALEGSGAEPASICLEITESAVMEDLEVTARAVAGLRGLGVTLAIDDFGTGYSSLAYLRHFPIDYVKLDGLFVTEVALDDRTALITRAAIDLVHSLGLAAVAEMVETPQQLESIRAMGCDYAQGFYWLRPLPAPRLLAWLEQQGEGTVRGPVGEPRPAPWRPPAPRCRSPHGS